MLKYWGWFTFTVVGMILNMGCVFYSEQHWESPFPFFKCCILGANLTAFAVLLILMAAILTPGGRDDE